MTTGITRQDVRRALGCGWTQDQLLDLHRKTSGVVLAVLVAGGWGFAVNGGRILVYRSYSKAQVQDALQDPMAVPRTTAYCDGSGTTANRPAGIGVAVYSEHRPPVLIAENIGPGTNNRAELVAIWRALRQHPLTNQSILIRSDSEYAIGALTQNWVRNANQPLIENIRQDLAYRAGCVEFQHVDGHSGHEGNEVADQLANIGRKLVTRVSEYEG